MNIKQAAESWNLTQNTVRKYCSSGLIRSCYKVDNQWIIRDGLERPMCVRKSYANTPSRQQARILKAMNGGKKITAEDLGCTEKDFKNHLNILKKNLLIYEKQGSSATDPVQNYLLTQNGVNLLNSNKGIVALSQEIDSSTSWLNSELNDKAYFLSVEYFDDMSFTSSVFSHSIIEPYLMTESNGRMQIDSSPELRIDSFKFGVGKLDDDVQAECDGKKKTVTISPDYVDDENVFLHEMIHAFEVLIDEFTAYSQFHDVVLISLYKDLNSKIPDLDERLINHAHIIRGVDITQNGGQHDLLFLLKSFDLDLKLEQPLGTICGYGRDQK